MDSLLGKGSYYSPNSTLHNLIYYTLIYRPLEKVFGQERVYSPHTEVLHPEDAQIPKPRRESLSYLGFGVLLLLLSILARLFLPLVSWSLLSLLLIGLPVVNGDSALRGGTGFLASTVVFQRPFEASNSQRAPLLQKSDVNPCSPPLWLVVGCNLVMRASHDSGVSSLWACILSRKPFTICAVIRPYRTIKCSII